MCDLPRSKFQFHKGTIKTSHLAFTPKSFTIFQFHKGTIKTLECEQWLPLLPLFQFHKGTIKTSTPRLPTSTNDYFNSIKVQLRLQ